VHEYLRLHQQSPAFSVCAPCPADFRRDLALEHVDHLEFALVGVILNDLGIAFADEADKHGRRPCPRVASLMPRSR